MQADSEYYCPELIKTLIDHEGAKPYLYLDSRNYWTIGIGTCIDERVKNPLTMDAMIYLLKDNLNQCRKQLSGQPFYVFADPVRKDLFVELVFNMGFHNLLEFNCIKHLNLCLPKNYNWKLAVDDFISSKWASEISKDRLDNMMYRLLHGEYP